MIVKLADFIQDFPQQLTGNMFLFYDNKKNGPTVGLGNQGSMSK